MTSSPSQLAQVTQPTIEELLEANRALQIRVEELTRANNELSSRIELADKQTEDALRKLEDRYEALFNSIDQGFCTLEVAFDENMKPLDYRFLEVSPSFEHQMGIKDGAGRWMRDIAPDQDGLWFEIYGQVALTREPARFEYFSTPLGRWWTVCAFGVDDPQLRRVGVLFNDITERKRAEEALQESEERLRAVFEQAPLAIAITGPSGEIRFRNETFDYLWGHTASDTSANKYSGVHVGYHLDGQPIAPHEWPGARAVLDGTSINGEVLEIVHASGRRIVCSFNAGPIRDDEGRITGAVVLFRDVTAEREAEAALRESEERFRALVSQATVGIAQTVEGRFTYVNDRFCQIAERSREELIGLTVGSITHPDQAERDMGLLKRMYETGEPFIVDTRYVHPDGSLGWVLNSVTPIRDSKAQIIGGFAASVDVTDRKRVEEALRMAHEEMERHVEERTAELAQANERLRHLSKRVLEVQEEERRHIARELHDEIGQYLTGLRFMLEKSKSEFEHQDDPHGTEDQLASSLGVLSDLTVRVRNLALDLRPMMLDDMGLLPALLWYVQRYQAQTGIEVEFHHMGLKKRLPIEVETAVYRVVQEALTNVARHSGARHVTLQVLSDGQVTMVIEDPGSGFDVERTLARHVSTGLSAMRERVELVGGEFTVDSSPTRGTIIIVDIPFVPGGTE
jgi:PAS domain S-box-containing protein